MYADIGGHATALVYIPLPRGVIPFAARGDVGQVHVVDLVLRSCIHLFLQCLDTVVQSQLQDGVGLTARLPFHRYQVVDVVGVQHQRFLADHVRSQPQSIADKGIVGIVRCTDAEPVQRVVRVHLLRAEAVELLLLGKEGAVRERTVQPAHAVKLVVGHQQVIARIGNSLNVPRGNIARSTNQCKIIHFFKGVRRS